MSHGATGRRCQSGRSEAAGTALTATGPRNAARAGLARCDIHSDFKTKTHIGVARCRPLHHYVPPFWLSHMNPSRGGMPTHRGHRRSRNLHAGAGMAAANRMPLRREWRTTRNGRAERSLSSRCLGPRPRLSPNRSKVLHRVRAGVPVSPFSFGSLSFARINGSHVHLAFDNASLNAGE